MTNRIPSRPDGEPIPCRGCQYFTGPGCGCDNAGHDRPQNPGPRPGLDQISSDDLDTLYARAENAEADLARVYRQYGEQSAANARYRIDIDHLRERLDHLTSHARAECDAMEQAMANGHASLSRLREHIARIRRMVDEAAR